LALASVLLIDARLLIDAVSVASSCDVSQSCHHSFSWRCGTPHCLAWRSARGHFAISMDRQQLFWPEIDQDIDIPSLFSHEPKTAHH
jgi:hypothetical protein